MYADASTNTNLHFNPAGHLFSLVPYLQAIGPHLVEALWIFGLRVSWGPEGERQDYLVTATVDHLIPHFSKLIPVL